MPQMIIGKIRFERYSVDGSGTVFADTQIEEFHCIVTFLNETFARLSPLQGDPKLPAVMALLDSYKGQIHECTFENPDRPGVVCHWHE